MSFVTEVLLRFRFLRQGLVAKYCMRPWSVTPVSSRLSVWSCGKPASNHTPFQPHAHCQHWLPPTHSISATCTLPTLASSYTLHFCHMALPTLASSYTLHFCHMALPTLASSSTHSISATWHCQHWLPPTHTPFRKICFCKHIRPDLLKLILKRYTEIKTHTLKLILKHYTGIKTHTCNNF